MMTNKTFDTLKWITLVFMPAFSTLVGAIGGAVSWEHTQLALVILTALTTFMGGLLGVSNINYKKEG